MDAWVIMPNHVHGILVLVEAGLKPASTAILRDGLPEIAQIFSGIGISWSSWRQDTAPSHAPQLEPNGRIRNIEAVAGDNRD